MNKLSGIPGVSHEDLQKLLRILEAEPGITEVVLYGSRAMGTYRPGSDIDLTLRGRSLSTGWLMDLAAKIDDLLLPYKVDLSIFEHIENPELLDHINRVGKVLYR